jgi:hypothetical protein
MDETHKALKLIGGWWWFFFFPLFIYFLESAEET